MYMYTYICMYIDIYIYMEMTHKNHNCGYLIVECTRGRSEKSLKNTNNILFLKPMGGNFIIFRRYIFIINNIPNVWHTIQYNFKRDMMNQLSYRVLISMIKIPYNDNNNNYIT
jgi:hypothetical protein